MNTKKGFAQIAVIVAVLLMLGLGGYYVATKNKVPAPEEQTESDTPSESVATETQTNSTTSNNPIVDCGTTAPASSGDLHDNDPAFSCLGKQIIANCNTSKLTLKKPEYSSATYDTETIEVAPLGNSCEITLKLGLALDINRKPYENSYVSCPVSSLLNTIPFEGSPTANPIGYAQGLYLTLLQAGSPEFGQNRAGKCEGTLISAVEKVRALEVQKNNDVEAQVKVARTEMSNAVDENSHNIASDKYIKALLYSIQANAKIYHQLIDKESYENVFEYKPISEILYKAFKLVTGYSPDKVKISSTKSAYAVAAQLKTSTNFWCVDSAGASRNSNSNSSPVSEGKCN